MKVHLIRAVEMDQDQYDQVNEVLQSQPGPLSFKCYPKGIEVKPRQQFQELVESWVKQEDDFAVGEDFAGHATWEEFFLACNDFRREHKLAEEDFVVLLTPQPNLVNWFSAFEEHTNNIFIHTDEWEEEYLHCSPVYPVSYLVMSQVLQKSLYENVEVNLEHAHQQPIGCINDICGNKRQIIFKLRTADICPICMEFIKEAGIRADLINQAFAVFEAVRKEMLFRQRFNIDLVPGRLHISDTNQVMLPDYGYEIDLSPLQKTVYFFFLKHPRGIVLKEREQYKGELALIYNQLDTRAAKDESVEDTNRRHKETISRLTDPRDNSLNENISNINKKIRKQLGEELSKYYTIPNSEKGVKRMPLDRSLVSCDNGII